MSTVCEGKTETNNARNLSQGPHSIVEGLISVSLSSVFQSFLISKLADKKYCKLISTNTKLIKGIKGTLKAVYIYNYIYIYIY